MLLALLQLVLHIFLNPIISIDVHIEKSQSFIPTRLFNRKYNNIITRHHCSSIDLNQLKESLGSEYFISREVQEDGATKLVWADEQMPLLRLARDARERVANIDRPPPFQPGDYAYVVSSKLKHSRGTVLKVERKDIGNSFKVLMLMDCRNNKGELLKSQYKFHGKGIWFYDSSLSNTPLDPSKSPPLPNSPEFSELIILEKPSKLEDAKTIEEVIELADPINLLNNLIISSQIVNSNDLKRLNKDSPLSATFKKMIDSSLNYILNCTNLDFSDYLKALFSISILHLKNRNYPLLPSVTTKIVNNLRMEKLTNLDTRDLSNIILSLYHIGRREVLLISNVCHILLNRDLSVKDLLTITFPLSKFNWSDSVVFNYFEESIQKNIKELSREESIIFLSNLSRVKSPNSNLLDMLYQKAVVRDSVYSRFPTLSYSKLILLLESVSGNFLYKKFIIEIKNLLPQIISISDWKDLKRIFICFKNAHEQNDTYYNWIYERAIKLSPAQTYEDWEKLLHFSYYVNKIHPVLFDLPIDTMNTLYIGKCLVSLSRLSTIYNLNDDDRERLIKLVDSLLGRYSIYPIEGLNLNTLKRVYKVLSSLFAMKIFSESLISKTLDLLLEVELDEKDVEMLSTWSLTITLLIAIEIQRSENDIIKFDKKYELLDQRLFDYANSLVNHIPVSRELINVIISALYTSALMGLSEKRDLSMIYDFCTNNIVQMDNAHLLMISDSIHKMGNDGNKWRALFANIKKGIDTITKENNYSSFDGT